MIKKAFLDKVIGRVISRKLTVFIIATFFALTAFLTADQWIDIAKLYIGTQATLDAVQVIKGEGSSSEPETPPKEPPTPHDPDR